jgi:lysophospholipase L1-like esterase
MKLSYVLAAGVLTVGLSLSGTNCSSQTAGNTGGSGGTSTSGSGGAGAGSGGTGGSHSSGGAGGSATGGAAGHATGDGGGDGGDSGGARDASPSPWLDGSPYNEGGGPHWVGTWTASPYYDSANQPPASLSGSVLRQVTHVSLGGSQIRVLFSNLFGNGPVTITMAHIALCVPTPAGDGGLPYVNSTIDTTTDTALAFSGAASVTIAQGQELWSDAIDFAVPNQGNITITTAFESVPSQVCGHSGSRTTSYLQTGSTNVSAASMTSAMTFANWFYISGIDVMADGSARGAVAIGDSITDGRGSNTDENDRWTDILAARLQGNAATANVSTMNQGIGGTDLIGTINNAAQGRFNRDVLGQSGVRYAMVLDGVNDIGAGASAAQLEAAYMDLISRAHAKDVVIYGCTITPFGGNAYYTPAHEAVRQAVNTWIRSTTSGFDGFIDFDAALTDGGIPPALQTVYATWSMMDGLHPGPAGYQEMGDIIKLSLFTR